MATLLEKKLRNYQSIYVTDYELKLVLGVGMFQRYGQLKRAVQKGDLIRIRRGLYYIANHISQKKPNPFEVAQKIYWPSYVSLESALSYHGLIPEAVYSVTSVTTKRSKNFQTPIGNFSYITLPKNNFLLEVERVDGGGSNFLVAKQWKAICDYVFCYKKDWKSVEPLTNSLRIELEDLPKISIDSVTAFIEYYKCRRITAFLKAVSGAFLL